MEGEGYGIIKSLTGRPGAAGSARHLADEGGGQLARKRLSGRRGSQALAWLGWGLGWGWGFGLGLGFGLGSG